MRFSTVIFRNMVRRPARVALTVVAMSVAVTAFVALVGLSSRFEDSFMDAYRSVDADVVVVSGGRQRLNSALDQTIADRLRKLPGVVEVASSMTDVIALEDYGVFAAGLQGIEPGSMLLRPLETIEGRELRDGDTGVMIVGKVLAMNLGKHAGDDIQIYGDRTYRIVGVFEAYNVVLDSVMIITLKDLQQLMAKPGQVTGFCLRVAKTGDPQADTQAIDRVIGEIKALGLELDALSVESHIDSLLQIQIIRGMAWLTGAIALIIGAVGVLNTMFASVLDRVHEIGVLRAIGWRKRRVVSMILWESIFMSLLAAALGVAGAMLLGHFLSRLPVVSGMIDGRIPWHTAVQGAVLAVVVGVIGAVYPALLGANVKPTQALRHE